MNKYGHYIRIIVRHVISEEDTFLLLSKGDMGAEPVSEVIAAQDQGLQTKHRTAEEYKQKQAANADCANRSTK